MGSIPFSGTTILTIQRITGHKTLEMLKRYNTIDVDEPRKAVERVARRKAGALTDRRGNV